MRCCLLLITFIFLLASAVQAQDLQEFIRSSDMLEPVSRLQPLPIEVNNRMDRDPLDADRLNQLIAMSDFCATVIVREYEADVVGLQGHDQILGLARLECEIVDDHLGSKTGRHEVFVYHVDIPGKITYAAPLSPDLESLKSQRILLCAGRVDEATGDHFIALQDGIFLYDKNDDLVDPFARELGKSLLKSTIAARQSISSFDKSYQDHDLVVVAEYVGIEGGLHAVHEECVEFQLVRLLKGDCESRLCVAELPLPESRVYSIKHVIGSNYLLMLDRGTDGEWVLSYPRLNSFLVRNGEIMSNSGERVVSLVELSR